MRNLLKEDSFSLGLGLSVSLSIGFLVMEYGYGSAVLLFALFLGVSVALLRLRKFRKHPQIAARLLKVILPSTEEKEYIVGDLLEEYNQFSSRPKAYFWLYKQVLKSALPLAYKIAKTRLASYFRGRIR
jgi:hypothetical protein